jgi:uncharacterized protein
MRFEWDEAKRQSNRQKHNLDFADAKLIFDGPIFTFEDDRFDYGEDRFITFGLLQDVVVVIAHTERNEVVRIISMRRATKYEQTLYFDSYS